MFDLPLHYDWVTCVKFSPQGSHILSSAYPNGSIKVLPCLVVHAAMFYVVILRLSKTNTLICLGNYIVEGLPSFSTKTSMESTYQIWYALIRSTINLKLVPATVCVVL